MGEYLENRVREVIAEQLGVSVDQVTASANLVSDLGADSLDIVEMIMALEDALEIDIPDDEAQKLATVKDVVALLEAKGASADKRK